MRAKRRPLTTSTRALVLIGAVWFASTARASAQGEGARHGLWGGAGFGYGLAGFSCDTCSHAPFSGWTFFLNGGVTASPHVRLGVEGDFWANGVHKGKLATVDTWTMLLSGYPRIRDGGPYVQGGVGLSHYSLEHGTGDFLEPVSTTEPAYAAAMGWGYTLGVGWEGRRGVGGSGITRVTYAYGNVGTLHTTKTTGWKQRLLLVEFGGVGP